MSRQDQGRPVFDTVARVLVVESDPGMAEALSRHLRRSGYRIKLARTGAEALRPGQTPDPDLVLLDLVLPGGEGLDVFHQLRERYAAPVILISPGADESERVFGLNLGADDFVPKPVAPQEVVARVGSVLRRTGDSRPAALLRVGPLVVDERSRRVHAFDRPVALTALEFKLLTYLMRHPDEVCSRRTLMEEVWGFDFGDTATVTVNIRRLREKIEVDPATPTLIRTVWGVGYRLEASGS